MNGNGHVAEEPVRLEGFGPQDLYQRREKIFTRFVGGFFQRLRFFTGWPLLAGYFLLPWVNWNGRQAILFDLPNRQFNIFEGTFFPQDFWLLGWLLIISAFALFTVTTLVGRLWCGYTCPQTVWTAVFMWAEQLAEGPRHARIRLDQAPWSFDKFRRRCLKHTLWLGFSALTGLAFVGYFTPIREFTLEILTFDAAGWGLFWTAFFTATTYVNAGWMREQVCIYMCPYARFQSAMLDKDTLIVSYDAARGEQRGPRKRTADRADIATGLGDCIDCQLCVQVCPTGIDIRNGLQYECIGCAHCIDACDQVMKKMNYAPGLIRYTTERELTEGKTHWLRGRSVGYGTVLLIMVAAFTIALLNRTEFEVDVLRERGELYRMGSDGQVSNAYSLRVVNKTQARQTYTAAVSSEHSIELVSADRVAADLTSQPGELVDVPMTLRMSAAAVSLPSVPVTVTVCETQTHHCVSEVTSFLGPTP